ncbi:MAG: protein translocase subunit SecD [Coriobacteriia bacterium]|nr:protein translocase subunit SecD [Coriobacteriia bacterium]
MADKTNSSRQARSSRAVEPKRHKITMVVLLIILVLCAVAFTPIGEKITQGLDLQGGVSVIMSASKPDGSEVSAEEMSQATAIVENRVNSLGASEATVQKSGATSILVQIPGATNPEEALETIGRTGFLEFVDIDVINALNVGTPNLELKQGTYEAFMTGGNIENVSIGQESQGSPYYAVNLRLDAEGSQIFKQKTAELAPLKGRIAIVLDGVINSAPTVQNVIPDGRVSITGGYSVEGAQQMKTILDSGSLPVNLNYSESRVVGPTLGQASLQQGLIAIAVGFAIVIIYLFIFYQGLGILTMGSLAVFAIVYLGILAALSQMGVFALSLPGIAGIVLTIGMAADSSILVLERFREELRMGHSIKTAAANGARHGIGTSIDADIVSLVSALSLFFIAVGPVKGFGLTLALGILCDIVTMFLFKLPALNLLAHFAIPKHPKFWGIASDVAEGKEKKMDIRRSRRA